MSVQISLGEFDLWVDYTFIAGCPGDRTTAPTGDEVEIESICTEMGSDHTELIMKHEKLAECVKRQVLEQHYERCRDW